MNLGVRRVKSTLYTAEVSSLTLYTLTMYRCIRLYTYTSRLCIFSNEHWRDVGGFGLKGGTRPETRQNS